MADMAEEKSERISSAQMYEFAFMGSGLILQGWEALFILKTDNTGSFLNAIATVLTMLMRGKNEA